MKYVVAIGILLLPLAAVPATLRMEGDRAWLDTEGASMSKVLNLFERCGVEVMVDPAIEFGRISGSWENAKIERVISQLVGPHGYVLEWTQVNGPLGRFYRLSSIRIFSDGNESAVARLSPGRRVLDIVEGADGIKYIRGEILIGFAEGATEKDLNALLEKLGGTVIEVIDPPGIYRIRIGDQLSVEEAMEIATSFDNVKGAEPNLAFPNLDRARVPLTKSGDGINLHLKPGENAVAVLDSGLDPQYADMPFIRGTYNALDPSSPIVDHTGHGTMTSLIASGALTPLGAEPSETGVPVLSILTFDENGMTSADTILRALDYAARSGVSIVSMSWGSEIDSSFMQAAMDYAAAHGMTLFAAAGNEPTGTPIYPAGYDSVIAVGGLNPDGTVWEQSNYGDFVQLYEPAWVVFNGETYAGTSDSSPYAAYKAASSTEPAVD
jgi:thermitase